jgi:parallel beta-helix repeat protein
MASMSQKSMNEINPKLSRISGKIQIDSIDDWSALKDEGLCTGVGTSSDPYIIEDLEIDGQGFGACITIDSKNIYFVIQNCTLFNADEAIVLQNVQNGKIIANDIQHNFQGIYAWQSSYNTIKDNFVNQNDDTGIYLDNADNNIITGNLASLSESGIRIDRSDNNQVSENILENNFHGINSWIMNGNQIIRNTIRNNDVGINIGEKSKCNTISDNTFSGNGVNIAGEQEFCLTFIIPLSIGILLGALTIILVIILIRRRKKSRNKEVSLVIPNIQKIDIDEKPLSKKVREMDEMYELTQELNQEDKIINQEQNFEEEISTEGPKLQTEDLFNVILKSEEKDRSETLSLKNIEQNGEKLQREEIARKLEKESIVFDEESSTPLEIASSEKKPENELETRETEKEIEVQISNIHEITCNYCGYLNNEDADFCVQCGQVLKKRP